MRKLAVIFLCLVMVICFVACGGENTKPDADNQSSAQETVEKTYPESWMKDAASDEMKQYTKYFRFADNWDILYEYTESDPENAEKDPFGSGFFVFSQEQYDNMLGTLVEKFEAEKADHPFAQKFIEEFGKTNYSELSDIEKLVFECYAKLLFGDENSTTDIKKYNVQNVTFMMSGIGVNAIDRLARAYTESDGKEVTLFLYFNESDSKTTKYFLRLTNGERRIRNQYYEDADISLPAQVQTELDIESLKKVIGDNMGFFEFLVQYRDFVYAEIREGEEFEKAQTNLPKFTQSNGEKKPQPKKSTEKKEPAIGMTRGEVLNSTWGAPQRKNVTENAWGKTEQWVYPSRGYVYLENDIVTSIQRHE